MESKNRKPPTAAVILLRCRKDVCFGGYPPDHFHISTIIRCLRVMIL